MSSHAHIEESVCCCAGDRNAIGQIGVQTKPHDIKTRSWRGERPLLCKSYNGRRVRVRNFSQCFTGLRRHCSQPISAAVLLVRCVVPRPTALPQAVSQVPRLSLRKFRCPGTTSKKRAPAPATQLDPAKISSNQMAVEERLASTCTTIQG